MDRQGLSRPRLGIPRCTRDAAGSDVALAEHEEDVRQAVRIILETGRGERVMRPDFGAGLDDFLFEPLNTTTLCARAASRRGGVDHVGAAHPRRGAWKYCSRPSERSRRLDIRIDYRVRATNTFYNLVYPVLCRARAAHERDARARRCSTRCCSGLPGYTPEWSPLREAAAHCAACRRSRGSPPCSTSGSTALPERGLLAGLDMLGMHLLPAQAARVPLVFAMQADSPLAVTLAAGSQVAAKPSPVAARPRRRRSAPPAEPIVFSTERTVTLTPARLVAAVQRRSRRGPLRRSQRRSLAEGFDALRRDGSSRRITSTSGTTRCSSSAGTSR